MDSLKLNMVAVDQIFPLLSDLVSAMMKVGGGGSCAACESACARLYLYLLIHAVPCHACLCAGHGCHASRVRVSVMH